MPFTAINLLSFSTGSEVAPIGQVFEDRLFWEPDYLIDNPPVSVLSQIGGESKRKVDELGSRLRIGTSLGGATRSARE